MASTSTQRPATPQDQFRIASITKTFVATLVLKAVAAGQLQLDQPVSRYAPRLAEKYPAIGTRTIRQLLSMRSGLPEGPDAALATFGSNPQNRTKAWTPAELIDLAMASGTVKEPDSTYPVYTNTNYIILGEVLKAVTGRRCGNWYATSSSNRWACHALNSPPSPTPPLPNPTQTVT